MATHWRRRHATRGWSTSLRSSVPPSCPTTWHQPEDAFRTLTRYPLRSAAMPSVQVGVCEVAYGLDGSGDPVVLVHGTSSSRDSWLQVTPVLSEQFTVICPE